MNLNFYVAPRYTAGSPASVNERIALKVAAEEKEAYQHELDGIYGEKAAARAQALGLQGIVEERKEFSKGWHCVDLITGRKFDRLSQVRAAKVQYNDTIVESYYSGGYTFLPAIGTDPKTKPFPFKVKASETVGKSVIYTNAEGWRLAVQKGDVFKVEREVVL